MKTRFERYKNEHRAQNVLSWIFAGLLGLSAVLFVLFVWFSPVYVADPSMAPTLTEGDTIFYDRLYKHFHELSRGDMVVYRDPETGSLLIKRVIALSGETVEAKDGVLIIDGKYGLDEHRYGAEAPIDFPETVVPEGTVFVLSDDRNYGEDSRKETIGCLGASEILGLVRVRLRDLTVFTQDS
ncbi:MAG: signal peptidase I [Clostridia bacterium]|nr:signal peptidase I [Clostridia bacterium]